MEERGAAYTVSRMGDMKVRSRCSSNRSRKTVMIQRIVAEYLKDRNK
jgi:hypothetical protein